METCANITVAAFIAHLRCPTKGYLMARGEKASNSFFADLRTDLSAAYKAKVGGAASVNFRELVGGLHNAVASTLVDSETTYYPLNKSALAGGKCRTKKAEPCLDYIPVLYSAWEKVEPSDNLLVAFGALAIGQAVGGETSPKGRIIWGEAQRLKTVRIADHLPKTRHAIAVIAAACRDREPPPLILNKHCAVCDFQSRCRAIAIGREDLSLLGAMTAKERAKCAEKGITTITQLSYGYRPRRRKRIHSTAARAGPPFKHDHKLRALAIKKAQTHVVGSPTLSFEGTPVFIDVEGSPDRGFYYLVGLRYGKKGECVELSFWADRPEDECTIWWKCLRSLKEIDNPRLVHYGAYESRFLKLMMERHKPLDGDAAFVEEIVDGSLNLLACVYGKIYFPTYSNSLKDIARWLGFDWTWPQASGGGSLLLRRCWELASDDALRLQLIRYNIEDCRATELVADAIGVICSDGEKSGALTLDSVNVSSLEVSFQRTFGKFPSALPEFEKINAAAYWDYQRSKVYVRTNKTIRRSVKKKKKRPVKYVAVEKEVTVDNRPRSCPKCGYSKIWIATRGSHVVFDLKFSRRGIKRWAVRYHYNSYRCAECKAQMTPHRSASKYGPNLRAYIVYLLIETRLSLQQIREHVAGVFDVSIPTTMVSCIKHDTAMKYEPTYRAILKEIADGFIAHADETKGVVYGGGHYVWIFANMTSVAYVYSASREASILDQALAGFSGVLVSDFYVGYDTMPCPQQKCLIHLMRDINDDVLKHPFNDELTFVAKRFGSLLRQIVETIDRWGLKKFHLRKHKRSVERFFTDVAALHCTTETGTALQKRIEKNREKLFTFLDHDGVPWNNNNAEHAVRAFTRLRNVMCTSTPNGTTDYCILLSLQQTLRYRGVGFLDFLRSGRSEIDL